ncbi:MAG: putative beta-barrel assembly-enhancing protease [Lysobacterales bacterium]|jgi:predicted Zn-dependent protease|nr:MAG: putative beta-barrel assembly-enhancing protease [Xanthomonadales bacterium]
MLRIRFLLLALPLALVAPAQAQSSRIELPDMGSSAGGILAPGEERRIREELSRELYRLGLVIEDPLLESYIEELGYRLVAASDTEAPDFRFLLLRLRTINAFAAPGGLIATHAGLVLAASREDELAAVLAHEVAHVTQRHILRRHENMQRASLPILLGMLGALAASAGRTDDAAQAVIVGGLSLLEQQAINYTRQNEYEADRIGIQILARAGFDPEAMAGMFQRLARASRGPEQAVPEYLRTHPVTTSRIAEARQRAQAQRETPPPVAATFPLHPALGGFPHPLPAAGTAPASDPLRFRLMQERLRVLSARVPDDAVAFYRSAARREMSADPATTYGHALALVEASRLDEAQPLIAALLANQAARLEFRLLDADLKQRRGDLAAARAAFRELLADHPAHPAIVFAYVDALLQRGDAESALEAQALLRGRLTPSEGPRLHRSFARAAELAGDEIRASEAHAEAAFASGHLEDALGILERLARRTDLDHYQRARIEARIADLTPLVLELRRRSLNPPERRAG